MELTAPLERAGVLLPRTRERIEREIAHFWVLELDGLLTACAALIPYAGSGEIACLVTHREYQGQDRAERLLRHRADCTTPRACAGFRFAPVPQPGSWNRAIALVRWLTSRKLAENSGRPSARRKC